MEIMSFRMEGSDWSITAYVWGDRSSLKYK